MIERLWTRPPSAAGRYALALGCVAAATPVVALLHRLVAGNLTVVYVPAVIVAAVLAGARPALVASVAAFLAYDVLFVVPEFTFTVSDPQEWVHLVVFLVTAIATGQIAAVARSTALEAQRNEHESATQFRLISAMTDSTLDDGLRAAAAILLAETGSSAVGIVLGGRLHASAGAPGTIARMEAPAAVMDAAIIARGHEAGGQRWLRPRREVRTGPNPESAFGRVRIASGEAEEGWLLLTPLDEALHDPRTQRTLLVAAALIGNAVRRDRLTRTANEAAVLRETERLRGSMLNAVSHDLRTPLSTIIASAESLLQHDVVWSRDEQDEFLHEIVLEGRRLDRMVRHLLDFSRIEAGALRLAPTWREPRDLLEQVVRRLGPLLDDHPISIDVPAGIDAVLVDDVAATEVVANLVENAAKHTPAGTPITLRARKEPGAFEVLVEDGGPGIPPSLLPHLFDAFTASRRSHPRGGGGLGLAIARAMVEAHGGTLRAENRAGGGARFVATFPQRVAPVPEPAFAGEEQPRG